MGRMKVFYRKEQTAAGHVSYSPSSQKPAKVVADWGDTVDVVGFEPASFDELVLAHDPNYVAGVLACARPNGFGDTFEAVARSLPYTSGSMVAAAKYAWEHKTMVCAPCSGFHHAEYARGGGFCTFNGLMVAAMVLKRDYPGIRVGILDCDVHYGNGTEGIIGRLDVQNVDHATAGELFSRLEDVPEFFQWLDEIIDSYIAAGVGAVLYQAGADPHIDDPLGGMLTTQELLERDMRVFERFSKARIPVAWNLAGGYQKRKDGSIPAVLEVHRNTKTACERFLG